MRVDFEPIKKEVEKELSCSAHSMDHIMRVYNMALNLAEGEEVDLDVIKASALLHDIARAKEDSDPTGSINHASLGAEMALPILKKAGFSEEKISHIQACIRTHRYRTGEKPSTKEAMILFDADKIDTVGAIGTARSCVWISKHKAPWYTDMAKIDIDHYLKTNHSGSREGKIQDKSKHSMYLDYEFKSRYLPEKMYTEKGREIARLRVAFYRSFLDQMEKEFKGLA